MEQEGLATTWIDGKPWYYVHDVSCMHAEYNCPGR